VISTGAVNCWGYNHSGQLGNGTTTDSLVPSPVADITIEDVPLEDIIAELFTSNDAKSQPA
jgi:hypothetical protein